MTDQGMCTREQQHQMVDWQAEWIWHGDDPAPFHFFAYVRRSFDLTQMPISAVLHITATDRYRLYVNGVYLGRGPERCDPRFQSYDTHDLHPNLSVGHNCIAVQLYFYGCDTGFTRDGRGGLLAQLEMIGITGDGSVEMIGTDGQWKIRAAQAWRRDVKPSGMGPGVTEVYDARRDPPDWMQPGFDDALWESATVVTPNAGMWCSRPEPRHIPFLGEQVIRPVRVVMVGEALDYQDARSTTDIAEFLSREIHTALRHAHFEDAEVLTVEEMSAPALAATSPHTLRDDVSEGIYDPFVLLDFGRQVNAFPRITVEGLAGSIVDVTYGEQLIEGRIAPIICATRCADRYIMRDGLQTFEFFEFKSFRYLQVTFRTGAVPVNIHAIEANTWQYPVPMRGVFTCSDLTLTRLWDACAATVQLCTEDAFMDSPLREKRNWSGDGSHALLGALAVWGDTAVVRRYFQLITQGAMGDGMLRMFYPGSDWMDWKTRFANCIPQHALVWASRVREYYTFSGCTEFLRELYPTLTALAGWCDRHVNTDGLLDRLPSQNWLDWTPSDIRGASFGTNAFMLHMLDDLAEIAETLGKPDDAACWRDKAGRVRQALQRLYWDDARGVFYDSLFRGKPTEISSELGNALSLLFDIAHPRQAERVIAQLLGGDDHLAPVTPLFFQYVVQALFKADRAVDAIRLMGDRFAPMLARSRTLWENWHPHVQETHISLTTAGAPDVFPDGRFETVVHSHQPCSIGLAHCGSVGFSLLLLTEILGIRPRRPGFDGCVLTPRVDLLDHAGGTLPSPRGDITVGWVKSPTETTLRIELPVDLIADLHLPTGKVVSLAGGKHAFAIER